MVSLVLRLSGEEEEVTLWVLPVTESMAGALQRIKEEKKLELHEVMNGHGFGVGKNNIWLKKSQSGEFRFEYQGVHTNGNILMWALRRYQYRAPKELGAGIFKTEDEIYEMLKKHVENDTFIRGVEYERELQRKLKIFHQHYEHMLNQEDNHPVHNEEKDNSGQPATLPESKSGGDEKSEPESDERSQQAPPLYR